MTEHKLNFAGNPSPGLLPLTVCLSEDQHIVVTRWEGTAYVDQVAYGVHASPGGIRAYDGATIELVAHDSV